MNVRVPLYLPARLRRRAAPKPPATPAAVQPPRKVLLAKPMPCGTHYPWSGAPGWLGGEASILLAMAEAGGDLAAHRKIHLKGTR